MKSNSFTSLNFKYYILIFSVLFFLIPLCCFARDGQIDIDEIIKRQEAERQSIEKISQTLNQITGKFDPTTRNEDDEIVKNDDKSDEINIDYFMNILSDNQLYSSIKEKIKKFVNYIGNNNNQIEKNELSFIFYSLIVLISFGFAILLNSVAPVTGKEVANFYMIIKDNIPNLSDIDNKNSQLVENQLNNISRVNFDENNINTYIDNDYNAQNSNTEYGLDSYQQLSQLAIAKLESFSNNSEFRAAYNHFQKNRVISGRALEDISQEADEVIANNPSDLNNQSLINLIMMSKNSNKYAGNEINDINSELNCMDIAFLESLSNNQLNTENNEIWAEKIIN